MCTISMSEKRWIGGRPVGQNSTPYHEQDTPSHSIRPASSRTKSRRRAKETRITLSIIPSHLSGGPDRAKQSANASRACTPFPRSALPLVSPGNLSSRLHFASLPLLKAPISLQTSILGFTLPLATTAPPTSTSTTITTTTSPPSSPPILAPTTTATTTTTTTSSTHTTA